MVSAPDSGLASALPADQPGTMDNSGSAHATGLGREGVVSGMVPTLAPSCALANLPLTGMQHMKVHAGPARPAQCSWSHLKEKSAARRPSRRGWAGFLPPVACASKAWRPARYLLLAPTCSWATGSGSWPTVGGCQAFEAPQLPEALI